MHQELIHTEERDGFTIRFYACEEDESPRNCFDWTGAEIDDLCHKIDNGELAWFCAKVTASREGIELGVDYLGACCYESAQAFVTADGYYPDMVDSAIAEARATLNKLCDCPA